MHDIAAPHGLSSSLVSRHLRLLRAALVVKADRQGKAVFYAAGDQHFSGVRSDMLEHIAKAHAVGAHRRRPSISAPDIWRL